MYRIIYPKFNTKEVFIITFSDLLNKVKNFFINSDRSSDNVDNLQLQALANKGAESPTVSFQLLFKIYKDILNSSMEQTKSVKLNINSAYLDDFNLETSKEKEFVKVNNPCDESLPQITGYYYWNKKFVSSGVYFNAALLNDVDFQSDNPAIEVYNFTQSSFTVLPFEYCSTEVPNPTIYDFLVDLTSETTLLNPIEEETDMDYYLYTADLKGKIYLAPLVEITEDAYTLQQLNQILNKNSSNTMFSRGELASIDSLEYNNITNLNLNVNNFQYFINLLTLNIENCNYNTIPDEICNLPKLNELNLSSNGITTFPDKLTNLSTLEILYLNTNNLDALPSNLSNFINLQNIHLSNNHLSDLSIFKDKNISVTALDQSIALAPITPTSTNQYELSLDFLHDMDNNIPQIDPDSISTGGQLVGNSIIWTWDASPSAGSELSFKFSSNSGSSSFSGTVSGLIA